MYAAKAYQKRADDLKKKEEKKNSPCLAHGFDPPDETDVNNAPGCGQAQDQPPLQGAVGLNVGRHVQGLPVPEVIDGRAVHTFLYKAWIDTKQIKLAQC